MTRRTEETSIRYCTHADEGDELTALRGVDGTIGASFYKDTTSLYIYGIHPEVGKRADVISMTLEQARELCMCIAEIEKIHAANQKVK